MHSVVTDNTSHLGAKSLGSRYLLASSIHLEDISKPAWIDVGTNGDIDIADRITKDFNCDVDRTSAGILTRSS